MRASGAWEQRFALAVQAAVQLNPALEATVRRITELRLTYYLLEWHFDLVIVGGGT